LSRIIRRNRHSPDCYTLHAHYTSCHWKNLRHATADEKAALGDRDILLIPKQYDVRAARWKGQKR
jgi:hypothetical protein